ncbi:Insulin-degrading enzyme [Rhynchospora pubera]|uniref:Insulin-degrading enzyme n=1 Tax=Rhynchospora pubera TaxID=906938 RepID=A0AAV8FJZ7_9POAL|nr:Insulin-degrading enzyme [Rhynchospora pubera]
MATVSDVQFIRARSDKREYRRIVLPNALQAMLISDAEIDKAAAVMGVSVGAFNDPDGINGLAHFLEHMLFYASEKYPEEDSYSKYITEHGGSTNASTSSERTNYYFDVNVDNLRGALDRFAQFFVKPLMSADAVSREINAVDSEHKKNLLSDGSRLNQLQKHLSSKDHPYHKFTTGSLETLDTGPKEKGLDIRKELLRFYSENYSANLMQLTVYGKESLDSLQSLVESLFSDVRNADKRWFKCPGNPCPEQYLQILVKTIPIMEGDYLRIVWPTTPGILHYKKAPHRYLSHLIGHEGEGSIFYILKQLGWAMSLMAWEGSDSKEYSFFSISIRLTDEGHNHMEDIVGIVFNYIDLLNDSGIHKWIFDEMAAISEIEFNYQDKFQPLNYALFINAMMPLFPPEEWLVGEFLPSKFDPILIQKTLDELSPEKVRIFWESKKFEGMTDLAEPWYGTSYSAQKITSDTIKQWMENAPDADLHLPEPNIFIPTDFTLHAPKEEVKFPKIIRTSPFSTLWHKPDNKFLVPKAYVVVDFHCPLANYSPEAEVLTSLFVALLRDYLNDYAYNAQIASLSYGIYSTTTGFQVAVMGYNDKMRLLIDAIMMQIAHFEVKPNRFAVFKETYSKDFENFKFSKPCSQATYYLNLMLNDQSWPLSENLEALSSLNADDLSNFVPNLLSRTFLECFVAGNIEAKEAELIVTGIEDILLKAPNSVSKPLLPSQYLTMRVVMLESGLKCLYRTKGLNPKDENSAIVQYIQIHQEEALLNVQLELFSLMASQPAFHQLRSVEQLGYITSLSSREDAGIRGLQVIIQSTVKNPDNLDARIDAFFASFESKIYELDDEEYERNVKALIDLKLEKFKNLWEESVYYWGEIISGTLNFDRFESEVEVLRGLKKQDFINFFDQYIKVDAPKRKTLSVKVFGSNHFAEYEKSSEERDPPQIYRVEDIFSFRRSRPLYSSLRSGLCQIAVTTKS